MDNFPRVEHFAKRNAAGVAFVKRTLRKLVGLNAVEEAAEEIGMSTMTSLKVVARTAFGALPLFRVKRTENAIETLQMWYNDVAETNGLSPIHVTGVWSPETQRAIEFMVEKYINAKK